LWFVSLAKCKCSQIWIVMATKSWFYLISIFMWIYYGIFTTSVFISEALHWNTSLKHFHAMSTFVCAISNDSKLLISSPFRWSRRRFKQTTSLNRLTSVHKELKPFRVCLCRQPRITPTASSQPRTAIRVGSGLNVAPTFSRPLAAGGSPVKTQFNFRQQDSCTFPLEHLHLSPVEPCQFCWLCHHRIG